MCLHLFTLQVMSSPGKKSPEAENNPPTDATQDLVPTNVFKRILQDTLLFATAQVQIMAEDEYDTKDTVLYWNLTEIIELCQLKDNIPVIRDGKYFGDRKIK